MAPTSPFKIDRRPWLVAALLLVVVVWILIRCFWLPIRITTVYIVRHAEKAGGGADPPLSAAGQARAQELAHVLGDEGIDAVFVTQLIRTQQTGAPLAAAVGVAAQQYPAADAAGLVATILAGHAGERVLVVGHSNTVDDVAAALGAGGLSDLAEDQFDRLFVVHRFSSVAHLDRLRYGVATP